MDRYINRYMYIQHVNERQRKGSFFSNQKKKRDVDVESVLRVVSDIDQ